MTTQLDDSYFSCTHLIRPRRARILAEQDSASDLSARTIDRGAAVAAPAQVMTLRLARAWVTVLPGATDWVSQTLPEITEPRPTVMRPRTVAPA